MVATAANDFIRHLRQPATARAICAGLPGSTLVGDPAREVVGIGALSSTAAGVLTFCDARDPSERLAQTGAAIVVVPAGTAEARADQTLVAVADVRAGFIDIVDALLPGSDRPPDPAHGVAAGADIDPSASIAPGAHVAPNASFRTSPVSASARRRAYAGACCRTRGSATTPRSAASST
jgi:UDP-3-O-[3-hydroxymyristoyl] glucosamine N-acyltransferase